MTFMNAQKKILIVGVGPDRRWVRAVDEFSALMMFFFSFALSFGGWVKCHIKVFCLLGLTGERKFRELTAMLNGRLAIGN